RMAAIMIDLHTHPFNLQYVPVAGILRLGPCPTLPPMRSPRSSWRSPQRIRPSMGAPCDGDVCSNSRSSDPFACPAHAGGGADGWFEPNNLAGNQMFDVSFAGGFTECARLLTFRTSIVILFLDKVFDTRKARRFAPRLEQLVSRTPEFGRRVIYGS